jgi:hypothetical protein
MISFSEAGDDWRALPSWVRWFLNLGYLWDRSAGKRRICLVSTPCDSPGAALIALGLMRRRLEVPDAGDLAAHLGHLRGLYSTAKTRIVLRRVNNRKRFCFAPADPDGTLWAHIMTDPTARYKIVEEFAHDWHLDGEPPIEVNRGAPMINNFVLQKLFENSNAVRNENLSRTDSSTCLAGRSSGESRTAEVLSTVRFRCEDEVVALGSLLTVHGWHEGRVSRVTYYNPRTRQLDRVSRLPLVVSADGAAALSRVHAEDQFSSSDLIGVIPRTTDQDQLEEVAQQLGSLSQWYTPEDLAVSSDDAVPAGVALVVLRKD